MIWSFCICQDSYANPDEFTSFFFLSFFLWQYWGLDSGLHDLPLEPLLSQGGGSEENSVGLSPEKVAGR
jgi:hypothetical protein